MRAFFYFALLLRLVSLNSDIVEIRNVLLSKPWTATTSRGIYLNDSKTIARISVLFYSNSTGTCALGNNAIDSNNRLSNFNWRLAATDDGETIIIITPTYKTTTIPVGRDLTPIQLMFMKNSEYNVRILNRNGNALLRFAPEGVDKENETLYVYFQ